MASVYQASDRVLQRTVAVKVLGPPYDQHPVLLERFRHEARAAALSHPNIVAVFDSGSQGDVHYIVMEYVQGETLADILGPSRLGGCCGAAAHIGCGRATPVSGHGHDGGSSCGRGGSCCGRSGCAVTSP